MSTCFPGTLFTHLLFVAVYQRLVTAFYDLQIEVFYALFFFLRGVCSNAKRTNDCRHGHPVWE